MAKETMDYLLSCDNQVEQKPLGFNETLYRMYWVQVMQNIEMKLRSPYTYMDLYVKSIYCENYERAKAITDVLRPLGYNTIDTHYLIPKFN